MNMTVTERDKKLLGFLAAFMVALLFFVAVFRPLSAKIKNWTGKLPRCRSCRQNMEIRL